MRRQGGDVRAPRTQADHEPLRAGGRLAASLRVLSSRPVEPEGDLFHRQFAELRQFLRREEVLQRRVDSLRRIDLSRLEPFTQVFGREIDVDDLIRHRDHVVGKTLLDSHARGALDDVMEALQVLDVQGGDDVDACTKDFLDVLITLCIAAAGGIRMGQFIHQRNGGPPLEHRIQVHLLQDDATVLDSSARHLFQIADLGNGLRSAVRFDEADHHVDALPPQPVSLLEHVVGLANPGGETKIDFQPATLLATDEIQETLRLGLQFVGGHCFYLYGS